MCHGPTAAGDGPAASALPSGVPSLVSFLGEDRWEAYVNVIMTGRGSMPAFAEELDRRDARRILQFLLDQERNPPEPEEESHSEDAPKAPSNTPSPPPSPEVP